MRRLLGRDKAMRELDDETVERLLGGRLSAHDVAPEFAGAVTILTALRAEPSSGELAQGPSVVAAMQRQIEGGSLVGPKKTWVRKALSVKAAAIAAGVLFTASAAAAATGNLPNPSDVLSKIGINVPGPDDQVGTHGKPGQNNGPSSSPGPNPHADFGLCTASNASDGHSNSSVFPPASVCSTVTHPGQPQGTGKPSATPPGTPPTSTANHGASSGRSGVGPDSSVGGGPGGGSNNSTNHPSHP